jgi:hypothetical protein
MSKGLAWFARQVPTEGSSDVNQGRVGEKEVPHSDQWINPPEHDAGTYRPDKFNRKHAIKGTNKSPGISRTMIEEIYRSNEAALEQGRYIFQYPLSWTSSVNKMVALRRIDTRPNDYMLDFKITFEYDSKSYIINIRCHIPSSYSIYDAFDAISADFKKHISKKEGLENVELFFKQEIDNNDQVLFCVIQESETDPWLPWIINPNPNHDLLKLFNFPLERQSEFYGIWHDRPFAFPNVRSRQKGDICIHSSFVTNSSSGYLGRGNEFYPSPSKIYSDEGQSFFYIEMSLDGRRRVPLPYETFILELSLIIDSDDYLGA